MASARSKAQAEGNNVEGALNRGEGERTHDEVVATLAEMVELAESLDLPALEAAKTAAFGAAASADPSTESDEHLEIDMAHLDWLVNQLHGPQRFEVLANASTALCAASGASWRELQELHKIERAAMQRHLQTAEEVREFEELVLRQEKMAPEALKEFSQHLTKAHKRIMSKRPEDMAGHDRGGSHDDENDLRMILKLSDAELRAGIQEFKARIMELEERALMQLLECQGGHSGEDQRDTMFLVESSSLTEDWCGEFTRSAGDKHAAWKKSDADMWLFDFEGQWCIGPAVSRDGCVKPVVQSAWRADVAVSPDEVREWLRWDPKLSFVPDPDIKVTKRQSANVLQEQEQALVFFRETVRCNEERVDLLRHAANNMRVGSLGYEGEGYEEGRLVSTHLPEEVLVVVEELLEELKQAELSGLLEEREHIRAPGRSKIDEVYLERLNDECIDLERRLDYARSSISSLSAEASNRPLSAEKLSAQGGMHSSPIAEESEKAFQKTELAEGWSQASTESEDHCSNQLCIDEGESWQEVERAFREVDTLCKEYIQVSVDHANLNEEKCKSDQRVQFFNQAIEVVEEQKRTFLHAMDLARGCCSQDRDGRHVTLKAEGPSPSPSQKAASAAAGALALAAGTGLGPSETLLLPEDASDKQTHIDNVKELLQTFICTHGFSYDKTTLLDQEEVLLELGREEHRLRSSCRELEQKLGAFVHEFVGIMRQQPRPLRGDADELTDADLGFFEALGNKDDDPSATKLQETLAKLRTLADSPLCVSDLRDDERSAIVARRRRLVKLPYPSSTLGSNEDSSRRADIEAQIAEVVRREKRCQQDDALLWRLGQDLLRHRNAHVKIVEPM